MTHNLIVLSAAALLLVSGPATAQESVPPSTAQGTPSGEPTAPQQDETGPAAGDAAQSNETSVPPKSKKKKKTDDDWGFRWTDRPSLQLGKGTRVDFRVRFQGDLDHVSVSSDPDDEGGSNVDVARRRVG